MRLALGTRGDVQPLAVLAAELLHKQPAAQAHLITHVGHQVRGSAGAKCGLSGHWAARSHNPRCARDMLPDLRVFMTGYAADTAGGMSGA